MPLAVVEKTAYGGGAFYMATALITGSAGFIGSHLAGRLLDEGWTVVGIDALEPGYGPELKKARLSQLCGRAGYHHTTGAIETPGALLDLMERHRPEVVIHLAAEAGVRASIENPEPFFRSNIAGTFALLEAARAYPPEHLVMASTSSAYGANTEMPYREVMKADWPMSFYAASKKATEAMAHAYSHIYGLPVTMFRFFTVYGPWGRPDMAYYLFTDAIMNGRPIKVFNHGEMERDFVFIDDLIKSIRLLMDAKPVRPAGEAEVPEGDSLSPVAAFRIVNIGKSRPDSLGDFINAIETATGRTAERQYMEMQKGDVRATWADTALLERLTGFVPATPLDVGIPRFVDWYLNYTGQSRDEA